MPVRRCPILSVCVPDRGHARNRMPIICLSVRARKGISNGTGKLGEYREITVRLHGARYRQQVRRAQAELRTQLAFSRLAMPMSRSRARQCYVFLRKHGRRPYARTRYEPSGCSTSWRHRGNTEEDRGQDS